MEKHSKRALKEQYKNREIIGGVYCIYCSGDKARYLRSTTDLQGAKNRFTFSVLTNSYPEMCMRDAWKQFGASAFSFEIMEEIKKKETQTESEFLSDVLTLYTLWEEKQKI